jgi:catechol 2,3-dioxygenase-like lactoylglutathione lyase family enzyme
MTVDLGLTHIALPVADVDQSIEFYATYAGMQVIHRRVDPASNLSITAGKTGGCQKSKNLV